MHITDLLLLLMDHYALINASTSEEKNIFLNKLKQDSFYYIVFFYLFSQSELFH